MCERVIRLGMLILLISLQLFNIFLLFSYVPSLNDTQRERNKLTFVIFEHLTLNLLGT